MFTSRQVHNYIRALTEPYPCAFTYFEGRRVNLLSSELYDYPYFGEPGRIYLKSKRGLLVCAKDRCLWIKDATFLDSGERLFDVARRYDKLSTVREVLMVNQNFVNTK
jgi:methionyl-tRNA formyltransferase